MVWNIVFVRHYQLKLMLWNKWRCAVKLNNNYKKWFWSFVKQSCICMSAFLGPGSKIISEEKHDWIRTLWYPIILLHLFLFLSTCVHCHILVIIISFICLYAWSKLYRWILSFPALFLYIFTVLMHSIFPKR